MNDLTPELEHQLSDDFDRVGGPRIGDAALIARLAAAASAATSAAAKQAPLRTLPRRKLPTRALLLAAVVALLASAAAARVWLGRGKSAPVAAATSAAARSVAPPPLSLPVTPVEAPPVAEAPAVTPPPGATSADLVHPETAEALFAKANAARRAGQNQRAAALYQQLQRTFPGAAEVQLSRVSLGRLLLEQRSAAAALGQFDHYLTAPGGLRAEALYGKARALGMLGRSSEERSAWEQLLRDYPTSVYAASAKARLGELH